MRLFERSWLLRQAVWVLVFLIVALGIAVCWYWNQPEGSKLTPLLGGVATGLLLVIVQYMFSWYEHIERDRLRLLGLKNVLKNKVDIGYYGKLIKKAKKRINLMGSTGSRFLNDFADDNGSHDEAKYLLEALGRGVKVRILLPNPKFLLDDESKSKAIQISERLRILSEQENFECRFFNHSPIHSIFHADNELLVGPFFPDLESRNTPALHVRDDAVLSDRYIEYFENEWGRCAPKS
jgi:hypothetical protein